MKWMHSLCLILCCSVISSCHSMVSQHRSEGRGLPGKARSFLKLLSGEQLNKTLFPFDSTERFNWHFVPKERKGIPVKELDSAQLKAAFSLLRETLSEQGYEKAKAIIELENVLKVLENRRADDHYRDPGKYYFSIFGEPSARDPWGWRIEGHHLSINYTSIGNRLISVTPEFMGANPAIVPSGPDKGKQVLKAETELAFRLLHSFNEGQLHKAVISDEAPRDIITGNQREALLKERKGIAFHELNREQQQQLMELLKVYAGNFRKEFSGELMARLKAAGIDSLRFVWAGSQEPGLGHPHYYRIQSPVVLIEYDNTQNNANHVHTVVRDLTNDFGEDALKQHYEQGH